MVQLRFCIVLLFALDEILALQENTTANALSNVEIKPKELKNTRRKKTKNRSTSSSSRSKEKGGSFDETSKSKESLELSTDLDSSDEKGSKKYERKSSEERKGWRKWHRKCHPCPEEMALKWRDPRIKWICGAYQRAQRSFKSLCMMHFRNCQDGTMFVKIHDHRCIDDSERSGKPHGDHFFYDYRVAISGDTSGSTASSDESSLPEESGDIYRDIFY